MMTMLPSASATEALQYDALQKEYVQQYCLETDVEGIVQDAEGNYAMVVTDMKVKSQELIPMGRQDVLLTSEDSVNALLNVEGVGQELKDDVMEMAQRAQAHEEYDGDNCNTISIYSPDLLSATQNVSPQYYDYNGHRMKVEIISADQDSGYVKLAQGSNLPSVIKGIIDVVIATISRESTVGTVVSNGIAYLSIFGAEVSLFTAILKHAGINQIYGTSSSKIETKLRWHYTRKYTYGELIPLSNEWRTGCVSSSATIEEYCFSYDLYNNNGQRIAKNDYIIKGNGILYSENYASTNLETAWLNLTHPWADDGISVKIGPLTFHLT